MELTLLQHGSMAGARLIFSRCMWLATECLELKRYTPTPKEQCLPAGRMVFHGPRQEILPYFSTVGFQPPERKNPADFVQEVSHTVRQLA